MLADHVTIGLEPVAILGELAVLDGPYLHPAAAFMVGFGERDWRNHAAKGEALDLLHALLDVLARRHGAALGLDRVAHRFGVDGGDHDAAIVIHADLLRRRHGLA